jgi:LuxR family quorum sensing-dependent transcriptional regulator
LQNILVYASDYDQPLLLSQVPGSRDLGQVVVRACAGAYVSEGIVQPRAFRNSLEHTLAFIRDLDRARNLEDVSAQVLRHAAPFGAEHVLSSTFPSVGSNGRQQLGNVLLNRWPGEWLTRYVSLGYVFRDPAVTRAQSAVTPFFWRELNPIVRDDPAGRRVMDEAGEFNLKEGFTTALVTLDGQKVGFSLAGRHLEICAETSGMLSLIASYAAARAIAIKREKAPDGPIVLTAREREALQWAAEGKADWEIGEVMSISEHGADKHMRSIRAKLGVINRTQAVAEAIRRGLII